MYRNDSGTPYCSTEGDGRAECTAFGSLTARKEREDRDVEEGKLCCPPDEVQIEVSGSAPFGETFERRAFYAATERPKDKSEQKRARLEEPTSRKTRDLDLWPSSPDTAMRLFRRKAAAAAAAATAAVTGATLAGREHRPKSALTARCDASSQSKTTLLLLLRPLQQLHLGVSSCGRLRTASKPKDTVARCFDCGPPAGCGTGPSPPARLCSFLKQRPAPPGQRRRRRRRCGGHCNSLRPRQARHQGPCVHTSAGASAGPAAPLPLTPSSSRQVTLLEAKDTLAGECSTAAAGGMQQSNPRVDRATWLRTVRSWLTASWRG